GALPVPTWRAVFEAVADGSASAGVVAIESSLAGTIRETYDLLDEFYDRGVRIVGEVTVPVRLALLALPGQSIEGIDRVYSHAQALVQADAFLRSRDWQVMTTYNTAGAARLIAEKRERRAAAIASPRAAELYGLDILANDIQSGEDNRTRFAVLAREASESFPGGGASDGPGAQVGAGAGGDGAGSERVLAGRRTTLVFAVRNVPGSLHRSLGVFAARGVNLSRLESRPTRRARWEYVFWVDADADASDPACAAALEELRGETEMVRILGSYPRAAED
ncbi:MAG TPA: prephenate dehydratase domain-containing protein, partial [Candidatus Limnocylindrales bacterium]|nr:prephenate dehydratase domain-containing protein [Candidatus Limnocylindrales bacterium]